MFSHQNSLRHLLKPEHYCSPSHFELELDHLFRPHWQFLATKSELRHDGDFMTLEWFGRPILLRRSADNYLAYENICSHRHCMLSNQERGNQPRLKCQYHGWEYDDQGHTAKIPDARCFRPWDRDNSRLNMYRVEACGDLLFVCLNPKAPSLREWLSPFFEETELRFQSPMWKLVHRWDYDCNANWKVPAENTLESYHVTALHPTSFGDTLPAEEKSEHQLESRFTALTFSSTMRIERIQARLSRWLGGQPTMTYLHRHIHPNTILVSTDSLTYVVMYLPTSPTTVRIRVRIFAIRGTRRGPLASYVSWIGGRIGRAKAVQIHSEDRAIYESQQKGLEYSRHPGVIGAREERIYYFQKYILESLGIPLPPDNSLAKSPLSTLDTHSPVD